MKAASYFQASSAHPAWPSAVPISRTCAGVIRQFGE